MPYTLHGVLMKINAKRIFEIYKQPYNCEIVKFNNTKMKGIHIPANLLQPRFI